jgi:hypothetical protein
MIAGRNSVGYEIQEKFTNVLYAEIPEIKKLAHGTVSKRISRH